jgi:glycosyltransferase involved in cell wall biosynthesis
MTLRSLLAQPDIQQAFVSHLQKNFAPRWASFDSKPWNHPWLTTRNLEAMKEYSKEIRAKLKQFRATHEAGQQPLNVAFVCNVANSNYTTAKALTSPGLRASLIMHPWDEYLLSQPEWEEYDGTVDAIEPFAVAAKKVDFPKVDNVIRAPLAERFGSLADMPAWTKASLYYRWHQFYQFLPLLEREREFDALFTMQSPWLAYLAQKPYVATHMGGDIWYECSRDDQLGHLQRTAFAGAKLFIASNPWSYAFARRYGMKNMVYLPTLLNSTDYAPGPAAHREEWQAKVGGDFFVLTTARADAYFKGSDLALRGFAEMCKTHPGARLIALGWGADVEKQQAMAEQLGIADRVLMVPIIGKKRLISFLQSADCLLDQFVLGYFGMTALESLACGLPVIMKLNEQQFAAYSEAGVPPVMNAASSGEVAEALRALANNPEMKRSLSHLSRDWFMSYSGGPEWREAYKDALFAAAKGYRFDYETSPLTAPLGDDETAYQADELSTAPTFPNYF